jgi:hypothetical protein
MAFGMPADFFVKPGFWQSTFKKIAVNLTFWHLACQNEKINPAPMG